MKDLTTIEYRIEPGVAWVVMNRPDSLNAIDQTMADELNWVFKTIGEDKMIRAVVLTGAGRAFCAGGDIKMMMAMVNDPDARYNFQRTLKELNTLVLSIRSVPKPVIAMINGPAAGAGLNLALACDLRICQLSSTFTESFVKIGLIPDAGGTFFLPRYVGLGVAAEMMFTGSTIEGLRAERLGLVNRAVPDDQLEEVVRDLANKLAAAPTKAIERAKQLLNQAFTGSLERQLAYELEAQTACIATNDFTEGVQAFVEKRAPAFQGA